MKKNFFTILLFMCLSQSSLIAQSFTLYLPSDVERFPNGNTLITDAGMVFNGTGSKVFEIDTAGNVVWKYDTGLNFAHSAKRLPNGNTLITDTNNDRVIEVNPSGQIVWDMSSGLDYPNHAELLDNGHLIITDRNHDRVIEVDRQGKIYWEYNNLTRPHNGKRLPNGNTLICNSEQKKIVEVDSAKNIVWEFSQGLIWPRNADRLPNGNTLITESKGNRVIEVNPSGQIVWEFNVGIGLPYDSDRLPNGNTLISDGNNKRVIEVSPQKVIVWQYPKSTQNYYQTEWIETWIPNIGTESNNGNKIYTRIQQPIRSLYPNEKFPAVIYALGGISPGAMIQDILAREGFVAVHFNAEGRVSQNPADKKSEGVEDYNGKIHQDDMKAVIDYVLQQPNIQTDNIGIYTQSYGITMGAGCVGRYPQLPVKWLLDLEGPSDSRVTCFDYFNDSIKTAQAYQLLGHYSRAKDPSPANNAWWDEREAIRFIDKFKGYYLRMQTEVDHAQPQGFYDHAYDMIRAATAKKYGGNGNCFWTRVNGSENQTNTIWSASNKPQFVSEQTDERLQAIQYIKELAAMSPLTSIDEKKIVDPNKFYLEQNYPNPFRSNTSISFQLSIVSNVKLEIFDVLGKKVAILIDEKRDAGYQSFQFDIRQSTFDIRSGVYFYRLSTPSSSSTKMMLYLK